MIYHRMADHRMKSHTLLIVGVFVLVFGTVSQAEIKIIVEHNSNEDATSAFHFKNIPAPSRFDAATQAAFSIVDGERDANGGDVGKLHDGRVPTDDDQPSGNFFFKAGIEVRRIVVDMGGSIGIRQGNMHSLRPL